MADQASSAIVARRGAGELVSRPPTNASGRAEPPARRSASRQLLSLQVLAKCCACFCSADIGIYVPTWIGTPK